MAKLEQVFFVIEHQRIEAQFDRSHLKMDSLVYVRFADDRKSATFSPQPFEGSSEYHVQWIAESEWVVELERKFELRPDFASRLEKEVGEFITREDIDAALAKLCGKIRMKRYRQTDVLARSPLTVIFTVLNRLEVCRRLNKTSSLPPEIAKHLPDPLVCYLYLTCFDRLGQSSDWKEFGAWLESSRHKEERSEILKKAERNSTDILGTIQSVHKQYNTIYGVKRGFVRFLREILPYDVKRELLDTIERTISTYAPRCTTRPATDEEKEQYLFQRRNDFTHSADFTPPAGEVFGRSVTNRVQESFANYWTSTCTHDWPEMLDKVVRVGLSHYVLNHRADD